MAKRIIFSFLLIVAILIFPFWAVYALAFLGIIFFPVYWEAIVLLFLVELLFGIRENSLWQFISKSTLGAILGLILIEYLKKKLRFYKK